MRLKILFVAILLLTLMSCDNSKKQYMDECSMVNAFVQELTKYDKQQFNRIIDDFFIKKSDEIPSDILNLYFEKFNYIKSINFNKSKCLIIKEGEYSIIELRKSDSRLFLRVIKHEKGFTIVNCIAMMKGDKIVGWI